MNEPSTPTTKAPDAAAPLVVAVKRTGGFAGLTREWTAEPQGAEASALIDIVLRCPWDDPVDDNPQGADRFVWNIYARCAPDDDRSADLPDHAITGPWRELDDAVRDWSDGTVRASS